MDRLEQDLRFYKIELERENNPFRRNLLLERIAYVEQRRVMGTCGNQSLAFYELKAPISQWIECYHQGRLQNVHLVRQHPKQMVKYPHLGKMHKTTGVEFKTHNTFFKIIFLLICCMLQA